MLFSLLTFITTTILLYLSSKTLITLILKILNLNILFFILLPGIFLHEFSHIFMATILRVPTGRLSLKPKLKNRTLMELGSAQIAVTDPIRLTLIGTAPFIFGTIILWLILTVGLKLNLNSLSITLFTQIPSYIIFIFSYLIFAISNTMFSSKSDLQSAGFPVFLLLFLLGIFKLANLQIPQIIIVFTVNFFTLLSVVFLLVLTLNLIIFLPLKILTKFMIH